VWSCRQPGLHQGEVQPFQPVGGPSAWTAADYKTNEQWIYRLREEDVKELECAVNGIVDSGVRVQVRMTGSAWRCCIGMYEAASK
jgi:hypothetical protein